MSEHTHSSMLPEGFLLAGRYRIDKYLSSGGCGNTYLVTDMKFARSSTRVVIKEFFLADRTYRSTGSSRVVVTNPDNQQIVTKLRSKFKREAELIFSLKHPNIVSVSDIFDANDTSYYVMQYVEGGSLARKLQDEGPLSEDDALRYIRQVLSALYVMHAEGLYHLDLKPANIMLDAYDNAVLIDFGASKMADDTSGKFSTTTPLYTRGFAPTEQIEGVLSRLGAWTDIYAVGATLYSLLSGMAPPMPSEILENSEEALALSDDVSPRTRNAIVAFMQQSMRKRPQNVEEAEVLLFGKVQKHLKPNRFFSDAIGEPVATQLPDAPKTEKPKVPALEKPDPTSAYETVLPTSEKPASVPVVEPASKPDSTSNRKKHLWSGILLVLAGVILLVLAGVIIIKDYKVVPDSIMFIDSTVDLSRLRLNGEFDGAPQKKQNTNPKSEKATTVSKPIPKPVSRKPSSSRKNTSPRTTTPPRHTQTSQSSGGISGRQIGGGSSTQSGASSTPASSGGLSGRRIGN